MTLRSTSPRFAGPLQVMRRSLRTVALHVSELMGETVARTRRPVATSVTSTLNDRFPHDVVLASLAFGAPLVMRRPEPSEEGRPTADPCAVAGEETRPEIEDPGAETAAVVETSDNPSR